MLDVRWGCLGEGGNAEAQRHKEEETPASLVYPWLGRRGLLQRERAAQRDVKRFVETAKGFEKQTCWKTAGSGCHRV